MNDPFASFDSDDEQVEDIRIRGDCEQMAIDLTEDEHLEKMREWSERSADFVEDMARRFIASDTWVPTRKQAMWLCRLHVRIDADGLGARLLEDLGE